MTTQQSTHSGGCLCGAVRFSASGEPLGSNHCHCGMCRKDSGSDDSFIDFRLGTFDDPAPFKAKMHLWMRTALPSFAGIDPDIASFDTGS